MATRDAIMPGPRTPVVDQSGRLDAAWYRFFVDLHERTGGGATDKVEDTNTTATTASAAAATAQVAADDAFALAQSVEQGEGILVESIQEILFLGEFGRGEDL